jgi:5-methylcytosine-specific restriction endonuclease McrA
VANQWTERAGHWLPPGAWEKCVGEPSFEPGERVWAAVDVGGERSATALAWLNEARHVGIAIFHGESGILEAAEAVRSLAETFVIAEITYDPMRAVQLGQELAERGITASAYPQTDVRTIPASARLRDAIVRQRLVPPDDPELRRHAANAIAPLEAARVEDRGPGSKLERRRDRRPDDGARPARKSARAGEAARMALKPCLTCGVLTEGSYCRAHEPWRPRGRLNRKLRARVFAAYGRRCRHCGRADGPLEVHHVNGDPADNRLANTIPLCRDCHHEVTFPRI